MHFFKNITAVLASTVCFTANSLYAQENTAPLLGIDAGLFLVPSTRVIERLQSLGINDLRDNTVWAHIETEKGKYNFGVDQQKGVDELNRAGLAGSLIIWADNANYEDGNTVLKSEGIDALAEFVSAYLEHYPDVRSIEIGNEFNSPSFIYGPIKEKSAQELAAVQVDYLKALNEHENVRNTRIIGASAHSIASAYIWEMLDLGAADYMDAVSIHTYTTEPEHIPAELSVLRRHPKMKDMDIEITEFGQRDLASAPDFFWRNYCTMAASGVKRAVWYPLTQRGDNYPPVLQSDMSLTPLGQALTYAHTKLQGKPVEFYQPDPFTYACVFGGSDAVIWGAPRDVAIRRHDMEPRRGDMREYDRELELMRDRVIFFHTDGAPIDLELDIDLGAQPIVADSYYQFFRPAEGENARTADGVEGFRRYLLVGSDDRIVDLETCPGQQRGGVPWRPYLCTTKEPNLWNFAWIPTGFNIVGGEDENMRVVLEHISEKEQMINIETDVKLNMLSSSGVTLDIIVAGETKVSTVVSGSDQSSFGPYAVPEGKEVKVIFGPSEMPQLYNGDFRVKLVNPLCACDQE